MSEYVVWLGLAVVSSLNPEQPPVARSIRKLVSSEELSVQARSILTSVTLVEESEVGGKSDGVVTEVTVP